MKYMNKKFVRIGNIRRLAVFVTAVIVGSFLSMPAEAVTLNSTQKLKLQYLIEEEKLARDIYTFLAANVTTQKFSNISKSEQTHMDQIANLLATYKVSNPTSGEAPGVFKNKTLAQLYSDLIYQGKTSTVAAFGVGVTVEKMDLSDLKSIRLIFTQSDALAALDLLAKGSQNHLAAFTR